MEAEMNGTYLKFYVHENRRLHHMLAYEWLLEKAKKLGIHGGSAFRALAGYGRRGGIHEEHFFELQGDLPVEVGFAVSDEVADRFLEVIREERASLFYVRFPIVFGLSTGEPIAPLERKANP
jgi:PII-like signaling protein